MRFTFIGNLAFNDKEDAKVPAVRKIGDSGIGINASVVAAVNNRAFVEATGWENDVIKTKDIDGNNIEINWEDRFDEDVVKNVASYRKYFITIDGDRKEFITAYDFCEFIRDNLDTIKDKRCIVKGQTQENFYKGKESKRLQINNIRLIDDDDDEKNILMFDTPFYWSKDGVDMTDFKDDKKIYFNGYTPEFVSAKDLGEDKGASKYIPIQLIINCAKVDFDNAEMITLLNYRLTNLGLMYKDGKIVNNLKGSKYYANEITISYHNGAQDMGDAEDITYDMLTDMQKMKCDLGFAKPEDFATNGRSFGERVVENRVYLFSGKGDYANGYIALDDTIDEFEDNIFIPSDDDDEIMPKPKKKDEDDEKPKKSKIKKVPDPEPEDEPEEEPEELNNEIEDIFR